LLHDAVFHHDDSIRHGHGFDLIVRELDDGILQTFVQP
jgi:hypothetical protein